MTSIIKNALAVSLLPALLLSGCGGGGSSGDNSSTTAAAAVSVAQTTGTPSVKLGDRVSWTATATNSGTGPTTGVITLVSAMPSNLGAVTLSPTSGVSCGAAVPNANVTCTVQPGLAPGATAGFVLSGTATALGNMSSSVTASGAGVTGSMGCASTTSCSATAAVTGSDVRVTAFIVNKPTTALTTDTLNWTVTVQNKGNAATAAPITLTDVLSGAAGVGSASITSTTGGMTCGAVSGGAVTCTLPTGFTAGSTATFVLSATPAGIGPETSTITPGSGATCDPSISCTTTTTVTLPSTPNVTVTQAADTVLHSIGDTMKWTITAVNSGTANTTTAISFTETLPAAGIDLTNVNAINATGGFTCGSVTGNTMTCSVAAGLAQGGGTAKIDITAPIVATGNTGVLVSSVAPVIVGGPTGATCPAVTTGGPLVSPSVDPCSPVKWLACGVTIDAPTLSGLFGAYTTVNALGSTTSGNPYFAVPTALSADPATIESYSTSGPGTGAMVSGSSGKQYICASRNGNVSGGTGATGGVKYDYSAKTIAFSTPNAATKPGSFMMFNLPSLTDFGIGFTASGSRGLYIDYTKDGVTWNTIYTGDVATATSPLSSLWAPKPQITGPLLVRVWVNPTSAGTVGGSLTVTNLMIQP